MPPRSTRYGMVRRTARRAYEFGGRTRRRSSGALAKSKEATSKALSRARKLRAELKDPMEATKNCGFVLAGSAASGFGAAKEWIPADIMNIDSDAVIGIALGAAGFATKRKELVYLGTGFLAPYVAHYTATEFK